MMDYEMYLYDDEIELFAISLTRAGAYLYPT